MTTNEALIKRISERARELFDSKQHNCAESVFMALNEALDGGLAPETAKRIATGLGGGLGASGGTCGALTGGVLGIGLIAKSDDAIARKKTLYPLAAGLQDRFRERFGSIDCRDLTRDLTNDRRVLCRAITAAATEMCAEMLLTAEDTPSDTEQMKG